jgi:hypothetical protein
LKEANCYQNAGGAGVSIGFGHSCKGRVVTVLGADHAADLDRSALPRAAEALIAAMARA